MPQWSYRIHIRQYLGEGESKKDMLACVNGIEKAVKALPDSLYYRGGKEPLDKMRKAARAGEIGWFNTSLGDLWSFFDYHRVWVELEPTKQASKQSSKQKTSEAAKA